MKVDPTDIRRSRTYNWLDEMIGSSNSLNEIRKVFLEYFAQEDHEIVASSSLVPQNDPTLMFTNAGMVQFKNVFTGLEERTYNRAVTSQKCVRAGGKHNDLENVGYTARHHTFFEMLGNFSFGDYFKERAIDLAWNLITKEYGLDANRLLVTVYAEDDIAYELWKKIAGLPDEKIIRIATSDNFWAMGDTGPCGPCSEIFYDHGDHIPGGPPGSPDEDGDRFVEIWNLVFMQYEQETIEKRVDLPKPSIDTGMGLERIGAVLQGTHDNYKTDLFRALIQQSAIATGTEPDGEHNISHRVIVDHLRASSFLIADGVLPSNEGRGYVLRRIMRRAMRHAHIVGATEPLMWKLVPTLLNQLGGHFKELGRAEALITETMKLEETRFQRTLERGLHLLDGELAKLGDGMALPGEVAFKLYDTYGFPIDLTEDALRVKGISVDKVGFETAMTHQKETARKSWSGSGEQATDAVWFSIREDVGATEFLGYTSGHAEGKLLALLSDGEQVDTVTKGDVVDLVINQTPFYGESGGQVGDQGVITTQDGLELKITDTWKRAGDLHVHHGEIVRGQLSIGDEIEMKVDEGLRNRSRANHSATHLLHEALRRVLGEHVTQKGSLVEPDRLRFDFAHPKPMTAEEIAEVEKIVNQYIRQNAAVSTRVMTPDDAIEAGALALFGEKYGDEVRVLAMGRDDAKANGIYSVELCGGTHVSRTGDIALLKVTSESAVGAGLRRIEALTGEAAMAYLAVRDSLVSQAATALKSRVEDVPDRVASLMEERKRLEKELAVARKELAMGGGQGKETGPEVINGLNLMARLLDGVSPRDLPGMIDDAKAQMGSGVVVLVAVNEGKAALAVGLTEDLVGKLNAVDLVKEAAAAVGGKGGGGRPDLAKAGGPDGANADQALDAVRAALKG